MSLSGTTLIWQEGSPLLPEAEQPGHPREIPGQSCSGYMVLVTPHTQHESPRVTGRPYLIPCCQEPLIHQWDAPGRVVPVKLYFDDAGAGTECMPVWLDGAYTA